MARPDAPRGECLTLLDETPERHAFTIGVYHGFKDFTDWTGLSSDALINPDVIAEPHYVKGGYVVGALLRYAIVVTLVLLIGPHVIP